MNAYEVLERWWNEEGKHRGDVIPSFDAMKKWCGTVKLAYPTPGTFYKWLETKDV